MLAAGEPAMPMDCGLTQLPQCGIFLGLLVRLVNKSPAEPKKSVPFIFFLCGHLLQTQQLLTHLLPDSREKSQGRSLPGVGKGSSFLTLLLGGLRRATRNPASPSTKDCSV